MMSLLCSRHSQNPTSPGLKPKPLQDPTKPCKFPHCLSDFTVSCPASLAAWSNYTDFFAILEHTRHASALGYLLLLSPLLALSFPDILMVSPHLLPVFTMRSPSQQGLFFSHLILCCSPFQYSL